MKRLIFFTASLIIPVLKWLVSRPAGTIANPEEENEMAANPYSKPTTERARGRLQNQLKSLKETKNGLEEEIKKIEEALQAPQATLASRPPTAQPERKPTWTPPATPLNSSNVARDPDR